MKKNIAVIGCGYWGKNLIRNFFELGSLNSISDLNNEIATTYSKKYNINNYSFNEILNNPNIEGVVLAVPASLHYSMAVEAMNKGKHVFVEKPLAMNKSESEDMIAVANKNSVKLMVGHLLLYHPIFIKIKNLVDKNMIGKLNYVYSNRLSFGKIRSFENVIWSFAPHDISMILSLAQQDPKSIMAQSSSFIQKNIADIATIHLNFESGLKSHITVSWINPQKEVKLVLIGEKGIMVFDDTKIWNEKLAVYYHNKISYPDLLEINKSNKEYIKVNEEEPLKNECRHFLDVIKQGLNPITDGLEGLRVIRVLSAVSKSLENNLSINL